MKPDLRDFVSWVELNGSSVAICGFLVTPSGEEISAKVKPGLFEASFRARGGSSGQRLGAMNIAASKSRGACVDKVSRIIWLQLVDLQKNLFGADEIAFRLL